MALAKYIVGGSQSLVTLDEVVPKATTGIAAHSLARGDSAGIKYTAWLQADNGSLGQQLDSNAEKDGFFKIVIGEHGKALAGWHDALTGVKKGGKRIAILPPALAYGPAGAPPTVPANATLIFELEVARVKRAEAPATTATSAPGIPAPPLAEPATPTQPAPQVLFDGFPSPADASVETLAQKEELLARLARAGAKPIAGSPAVHMQHVQQMPPQQMLPPQQQQQQAYAPQQQPHAHAVSFSLFLGFLACP